MSSTSHVALGALFILGGAYLLRKKLEKDDADHRENRPQDFWHGVNISAMRQGSDEERKIQGRLVARAAQISNRLDPADFARKYAQLQRDYRSGAFKFNN